MEGMAYSTVILKLMKRFLTKIALCLVALAGVSACAMPLGIRTAMYGRAASRQTTSTPAPTPDPQPDPTSDPTPTPTPDPTLEPMPTPIPRPGLDDATLVLWTTVPSGTVPHVASTYDGYLYKGGAITGTIQVKVGKPNKRTGLAAVRATVVGLDGKKKKLKAAPRGKARIETSGPTTVRFAGEVTCEVMLGAKDMFGTYGAYVIDGSRNVFVSKDTADRTVAEAVLGKWKGSMNVAWRRGEDTAPYQTVSVNIANRGKAKVTGTLADGVKVSANGQLIVGEEWCCVPVVCAKRGVNLAFALWLPLRGSGTRAASSFPTVVGLGENVNVGKPGALKAGATFRMDARLGDAKYAAYLPDGVPVVGGTRWTLPKSGKVVFLRGTTNVDETKLGENPSALKLSYKAKGGTFKGSFKAYAEVNGKPKATRVNVAGVLIGNTGYGSAIIKKAGGVSVTVE